MSKTESNDFDFPLLTEAEIHSKIHDMRTAIAVLLLPVLALVAALILTVVIPEYEFTELSAAGGLFILTILSLSIIRQYRVDLTHHVELNEIQFREVVQYADRLAALKPYLRKVGQQGRALYVFELLAIRLWVRSQTTAQDSARRHNKVDPYMVLPTPPGQTIPPGTGRFNAVIDD